MPTKRQISIPIIKRVHTGVTPFQFVIYGLDDNRIIVEEPNQDHCYLLPKSKINRYIKINNQVTPWLNDINGNKFKLDKDVIQQSAKVTEGTDRYNITIAIPPEDFNTLVKNPDKFETFTLDADMKTITVALPILPVTLVCMKSVRYDRLELRKFLMEYNGNWYKFPYGNTNVDGGMCLGTTRTAGTPKELFWRIITSTCNFDLFFRMRCIYEDDSMLENCLTREAIEVFFDFDHISEKIKNGNLVQLYQCLYYLSKVDLNEFDPDKVFEKAIPDWEMET